MRLYVWKEVLSDYTPGLAIALAESEDEARRMLWEQIGFTPRTGDYQHYDWTGLSDPPTEVRDLDQAYAVYVWGGG